jgi:phospholipid/cholesterol/gamma-HCH transport system permease protein
MARDEGELRIALPQRLTSADVAPLFRRWTSTLDVLPPGGRVLVDLSAVTRIDSAGAGLIACWRSRAESHDRHFALRGAIPEVASVVDLYGRAPAVDAAETTRPQGFFEGIGASGVEATESAVSFLVVLTDTVYFLPTTLFKNWRKRRTAIAEEMYRIGAQSLGIVAFLSFLVGLTTALQAAYQLRQFGANIFLANLVGLSMMREMGPLLMAILLAGRIGSSTAAEIATRVITEEIDALKTMGVNPIEYVVVPKFIAITITGPLLAVMATVVGIFGGYLIGVLYLDLGHTQFMNQLLESLYLKDYITGIIKSIAFSWAIIQIGAWKGLSTRGGPLEVGTATTSAVVVSLFSVIVLDALFSMLFYFG